MNAAAGCVEVSRTLTANETALISTTLDRNRPRRHRMPARHGQIR